MAKNLLKRIAKYNKGRNPQLLELKYEALAESAFRFFRGTCHLFYEDMPKKSFLLKSPKTWLCGDLHLENFGSFKGDNRLAYFDMNDFDESFLGPCLLDVVRCCTSVFLATDLVAIKTADCREPARMFLRAYANALTTGYIGSVEKETAHGVVEELLEAVTARTRKELLEKRISIKKHPKIKADGLKAIAADDATKQKVKTAVEQWAKKNALHPKFFKVYDVANRGIGTGSIGIERHLVLINGRGGPRGYHLLDLKEAIQPSALLSLRLKQPQWKNEAERLITIQSRVQASTPAFFSSIKLGKKWFVMKELQPLEDKINFESMKNDKTKLIDLLHEMGKIVAWNNLRSGGRQDSAIADSMIEFGWKLSKQENKILDYAEHYANTVRKYYKEYKKQYKPAGKNKKPTQKADVKTLLSQDLGLVTSL